MSVTLMVSARNEGRKHWFNEWSDMNRANIAEHHQAHMVTTMRNGDVYLWKVLDESFLSLEVDAIHFDDRCAVRLTPEQEGLYAQLKYRVRPRPYNLSPLVPMLSLELASATRGEVFAAVGNRDIPLDILGEVLCQLLVRVNRKGRLTVDDALDMCGFARVKLPPAD